MGRLGVEVIRRAEPHLPKALEAGRRQVRTSWFTTLDDDDLLLPGALTARLEALAAHPTWQVVVSNGFRRYHVGVDVLHFTDPASIRRDPLSMLGRGNWLLPGSWLASSAAFGPELFAEMPRNLECTYLAIRFAQTGPMGILETPTVVWHPGGPTSTSRDFLLGQPAALRHLLALDLPRPLARRFRERLVSAHHDISEDSRRRGEWAQAWRHHLASLALGGWRHLPYTRRLLTVSRGKLTLDPPGKHSNPP
jgi:hypothetical protein